MTTNPFITTTSGLAPNAGLLGTPGAIVATSITSQPITTGSLTFAIQAQCAFATGMWVSITNTADNTQWMWGTVVSYDGVSQLVVNVANSNGGGTVSSWNIALAGEPNTEGATGPLGPTGPTGAAAGPVAADTLGLKVTNDTGTPSTKVDIKAQVAIMVNTSGTSVTSAVVSVVVDLTTGTSTSAANGMDGEARGTSAWIYLYLISNGTTTSGLATTHSPLSSAPTMPSGYSYAAYVGAMRVDGSGNLLRTIQIGNRGQYTVSSATNTAALPTIISGVLGSVTSPTWQSEPVAAFVPATAATIAIVLNANTAADVAMVAPNNGYGAYTSTTNAPPFVSVGTQPVPGEFVLESANLYYAANVSTALLQCVGWTDYMVAA